MAVLNGRLTVSISDTRPGGTPVSITSLGFTSGEVLHKVCRCPLAGVNIAPGEVVSCAECGEPWIMDSPST